MAAKRNPKMIRFIQQAIKDLGLTESEYRAVYRSCTGKDGISGTRDAKGREKDGMDNKDLARVVVAMKDLLRQAGIGYENEKPKNKGVTLCSSPQARKIRSQWLTLHGLGAVKDASEKALLAYVQRRIGVPRMEWAQSNQLSYVIEQLKAWIGRVEEQRAAQAASARPGQNDQPGHVRMGGQADQPGHVPMADHAPMRGAAPATRYRSLLWR